MSGDAPVLIVLTGPNGAGKTTFFSAYLSDLGLPFLNADRMAEELELDAYTAADVVAHIRDEMIAARESFVLESVFSDPVGEKVEVLGAAVEAGYEVELVYIGLKNVALSRQRVLDRVQAGGHPVPLEKLKDRYARSLNNLQLAVRQLPRVRLYDNSSYRDPHRFIAEFQHGELVRRSEGSFPAWASFVGDLPATGDR